MLFSSVNILYLVFYVCRSLWCVVSRVVSDETWCVSVSSYITYRDVMMLLNFSSHIWVCVCAGTHFHYSWQAHQAVLIQDQHSVLIQDQHSCLVIFLYCFDAVGLFVRWQEEHPAYNLLQQLQKVLSWESGITWINRSLIIKNRRWCCWNWDCHRALICL